MAARLGILTAVLVAGAAASGPAAAQMPGTGCWLNDEPTFLVNVCVSDGAGKSAEVRWDEPEDQMYARSYGHCLGSVEFTDLAPSTFTMTVPRLEDGCFQDGEVTRLALRIYDCVWLEAGDSFSCYETVLLDDGSVFGEVADVLFELYSEVPAQ
ncbi:MAG: hypothetical protein KDA49_09630 [Rhodospirillaceae bacterium]|nr:hypothetical protein [Rhodospirillaceae bacterium]MCA8932714.1 hypothetical protein [Rhodospirillaceae bacterium]